MKAFGIENLSEKTGKSVASLYRWMRAIEDGRGIRDPNKRLLMTATKGTAQELSWSDFAPAQQVAA